jgi:cold shock protein
MSSSSAAVSSSERFTGRVKWFNNKAGYGFVTVTDGPKSGTDVFVHHTSIKVDTEQYKYLVQGEYIEFSLSDTKGNDHEYQAGDVSGIKGGKLMCETRRESRSARTQYRVTKSDNEETSEPVKMPRSLAAPKSTDNKSKSVRARGQGPREEGEWTYVKTKRTSNTDQTQKSAPRGRGRPPKSDSKDKSQNQSSQL